MSKKLLDRLNAFIKEVEELEKTDQFDEDGFSRHFRELRSLGMAHREDKKFPAEEGKKDENIKKNRYKDILPFDATRVTLQPKPGEPGSDYINANFVRGANGKKAYIASQGPLPHTVQDFWRMLWEYKIEVVVMVCQEVEAGKPKCERYWTKNPKEEKQFGDIHVKLLEEIHVSMFFCMRKLGVWKSNQENHMRTITHFHYSGWMDHDIPHDFGDIIDLLSRMRQHQTNDDIPVVIHCSAGCGRTGTICAIDYVVNMLKERIISDNFSLYDIILDMRSQRQSMVQTPDQYKVVHLAVKQMFENEVKQMSIEQHNYENVLLEDKPAIKTSQTEHPTKKQLHEEDSISKPVSKSAQSPKDQTVSSKQTTQAQNPFAKAAKPTSIALTKPNVKPDVLNKKPAISDGKPLLSPKPVLDAESKLVTSYKQDHPGDSHSSAPAKAHSIPISYENVSSLKKPETPSQKYVTKITVGPEAGNQSPTKNPKLKGRNNQPVALAPTDNAASSSRGKGPDKSRLYSNTEHGAEKGGQKIKAVAPSIAQGISVFSPPDTAPTQGRIDKSPVSGKNEKIPQPGAIQRIEVQGSEYALVSRSGKLSGSSTTVPISTRPPAVLPHSSSPASGPYEDVDTEGNKDYSYAEHNATDKWPHQGLARKCEQKNQAPTRPPNPYEEIDVDTMTKKGVTSWSDCTYASVDNPDIDFNHPPVPVPAKTPEAYIDEDEEPIEKKKTWGMISSITSKAEVISGRLKGKQAKESEAVALNNKHIKGFGHRVGKPVGSRPIPKGWSRESSL
ncbi:tyrosine-protein phosphatase non-receptor type 12-like [Liolophura sinensis]|uniref:tyrosine-protein phosphatase non-receptor type 12-like n=1 Tax=Liolophura sinensis TaxID=3198878 RepID=UPI0031592C30